MPPTVIDWRLNPVTEKSLALVQRVREHVLPRAQRRLNQAGEQINRSIDLEIESTQRLLDRTKAPPFLRSSV